MCQPDDERKPPGQSGANWYTGQATKLSPDERRRPPRSAGNKPPKTPGWQPPPRTKKRRGFLDPPDEWNS